MMRLCCICGASVRNQNPKCDTCDPICTRAKYAGVSREEQISVDMDTEEKEELLWEKIHREYPAWHQ
jgi:hypothetical protein